MNVGNGKIIATFKGKDLFRPTPLRDYLSDSK